MHFAALPDVRADQSPTAPCVADDTTGRVGNAQFHDLVRTYADRLSVAGVAAGDVVAVMLPNRLELIVALFAAWRLGAAATPINPSLTSAEVGYQLTDSGAHALICSDGAGEDTAVPVLLTLSDLDRHTGTGPPVTPDDFATDTLALLVYTSGTTGKPKGVELTHANITAMAETMIAAMALTADDHSLLILPLFHVNGIVVSVLSPLLAGGQATVAGRFAPTTFFDKVHAAKPTYFSAVPAIYAMLSTLPDEVQPDTSSLRFAVCGAAPMPVELLIGFEQRYHIPVIEGYGLSEATCASTSNPLGGVRKPGTVGPALPGQQIAIVDGHGNFVTDGSAGEVVVKGPTVMRGYLGRPEETARTVTDGWLHTGDVGRLDEDGYLTLVDRKKDMIIRGGENIYPKEIESAIYTHPQVLEAAVVGRAHPVFGEVPVAFVSYRDGAEISAEQMLDHLRKSLAKFKLPAEIVSLDEVPKNPVGKIDKPTLRTRLTESSV
ncbi:MULTISPECIES: class I adenylate-forming enzyme family protein [Rhodococcus]|uniref:AMP-binding protein n=1 Tax=Rhodococcus oxybenzonivorans TaxID=1990687 RepID=A0AAE5A5Q9_9NOCA|nr:MULTISPECIES: AMP-binding protein [Rhodococcus]MDV7243439.1 AMP-binding protein [Rhodococcus oxybenzonivorans]MDV7265145.1 AMP-binding protein [Rhodococcus oxybenzonivorans]MDV7277415.1 AMP-binding protein [Rhodococcus oxybenzonivorans]MDV7335557.1 AMP-binding protein [Rhodococcus oxybenzonivorans]MDV7347127.1 AMP-binding protein [Rhodococcus oxybenzonivorans]